MATNIGILKTETDMIGRNSAITTHKHDLLAISHKASLFSETSAVIFAAVNFRVCVLSKTAVNKEQEKRLTQNYFDCHIPV